ncbi:rhombosortase [Gilvimarinus xylanilyticus]|uniref:Rhombosortase n=1 Tax=Gilvimarinus xylanilyticus TaxID=2944139 RepID=A0A9X2KTN1_9GAMM|nr:rhombosortase [Gilvimarinus xylanilyticus]MCP8898948.1 rhombosortase [Gilvimarinus xylanilyticus]
MKFSQLSSFIGLAILTLPLGVLHEAVNPSLQYDPQAIRSGEIWRLLTAHIVHLSAIHAALNLAALGLMMYGFGQSRSTPSLAFCALVSALTISLSLFFWQPQVSYYVGLSGVLHGLFLFMLLPLCSQKSVLAWAALALLVVKLVYEYWNQVANAATEQLIGGPVLTVAHWYGAVSGMLASGLWCSYRTLTRQCSATRKSDQSN